MARYLSGIQASGLPHLGNYFGAIEQHIETSRSAAHESFFFIADYHALTTWDDKETLETNVRGVAATYLALGLDAERAVFFRQSDVPEVTELTWLLSSCTGMGLLERAHSFKDKTAKGITPTVGLFTYPVLMAADILIYDSDIVPVGQDQVQHIEMTQDMAGHFNSRFAAGGEPVLKKPNWVLSKTPKVPGTDGQKMSKSYGNFIPIFVSGKALKKAVNAIVTDSRPPEEAKDPKELNAMAILELFLDEEETRDWHARVSKGGEGAPGYGHMKKEIMARMDARFGEARERFFGYMEDKGQQQQLDDIVHAGGLRARAVAQQVLARCYETVGMSSAARRLAR